MTRTHEELLLFCALWMSAGGMIVGHILRGLARRHYRFRRMDWPVAALGMLLWPLLLPLVLMP